MSDHSKKSPPPASSERIEQEAAEWVIRRDRGLSAEESEALARWQSDDPRQAAEFARISSGWLSLNGLSAVPELTDAADAVVAAARARQRRVRWFRLATVSLATAAAVSLGFVSWWRPAPRPAPAFQVVAATSRTIPLPDGSEAIVNGDSRIAVEYAPEERRVRLLAGEAHFTVTKDAHRPFLVVAGPVVVRAVGTAFDVRYAPTAIEVLVTEGRVQVTNHASGASLLPTAADTASTTEPVLNAGERVVVNLSPQVDARAQVRVSEVAAAEIEQALAWQSAWLVFNETPLDEVVAAFNQHNTRRLSMGDDTLRAKRITGVFRADNLDGFLRLLHAGAGVRTENRSEGLTVLLPVD